MENKLVINVCYGGFGLSRKALDKLIEYGDEKAIDFLNLFKLKVLNEEYDEIEDFHCNLYSDERNNKNLIRVVEELGKEVNTKYSKLEIIIINSDRYKITDYDDGRESVTTPETIKWTFF